MDIFQTSVSSLSHQDLDNFKLIFSIVGSLLIFCSYFILTKNGRSQLGRAFRPFLIIFLISCVISIGGIFSTEAVRDWLSTSTDPDIPGRQLDKIAEIGINVSIDGYSVSIPRQATVKNCKTPEYLTIGQHNPTWCEVTVYARFTCELSESEQCYGPVVISTEDKEGKNVYFSNSTIISSEETLRSGETIAFEQVFKMDLNRPSIYLGTNHGEQYLHLVIMGPEGRSLMRHKAYLALGQRD